MTDHRKVGAYFKARGKMKEIMNDRIKPRSRWTKKVISDLEKALKNYKKAYGEQERLCREK